MAFDYDGFLRTRVYQDPESLSAYPFVGRGWCVACGRRWVATGKSEWNVQETLKARFRRHRTPAGQPCLAGQHIYAADYERYRLGNKERPRGATQDQQSTRSGH